MSRGYRHGVMYEIDGEAHTLQDWARISGIARSTLHRRMSERGVTLEEAIRMGRGVKQGGEKRPPVPEWPEVIAICTHCTAPECEGDCAYRREMARQITAAHTRKGALHEFEGKSRTVREWANLYGISINRMRHMIRDKHMSVADIIRQETKQKQVETRRPRPTQWPETVALCAKCEERANCTGDCERRRARVRAVYANRRHGKLYEMGGEIRNIRGWAEKYGININRMYYLLCQRHMTIEEAIEASVGRE